MMPSFFNKPEYLFNPVQILRKLLQKPAGNELVTVQLPWKRKIRVKPKETIGHAIYKSRVFELEVCETIWRLLDEDALVVDIGSNIGFMTSVMSARMKNGKIICFEPHPDIFTLLCHNIGNWKPLNRKVRIEAFPVALSDKAGVAQLFTGSYFNTNAGIASLTLNQDFPESIAVQTDTLSGYIGDGDYIHLMKMDVEGHELSVLNGCRELFEKQRVRDVIFEAIGSISSQLLDFFFAHGYAVFFLEKTLLKVKLHEVLPGTTALSFPGLNFLASLDPNRVVKRTKKIGWHILWQ